MNHRKLTKSGKYTTHKGTFLPVHKERYQGDSPPKFKSKLEQAFMTWCDKNPLVLKWSYERIVIPYMDSTRLTQNGKPTKHRYYVDGKVTIKTKTGTKTFLVEVKSEKETIKPVNSKNKKPENYRKEMETWIRNQCKWASASESAKKRGWEFKILTERHLN